MDAKFKLQLLYHKLKTNKQTNKKYALIYNYSVYVTRVTWWPSQQIRLPTTLSQANKFHFARFSSYTIKTYWTRTFPYSITNISILIQGYDWEVTGTNRTNLAWILFWSEFFTTVLWSLFPVNTCKWERIHHQQQRQVNRITITRYGLLHLGIYCHGLEEEQKEIVTEKLVIK